ncbi:MAG TPA: hypothetical protein VNN80_13810, partial [Polyangiaceae bacterium]|nr:hypothetical protein [Polyangiaceae bacterium]
SRPVAPAEAPAFAEGERAGLPGCASTETGLGALGSDAQEARAALVGRWVGCAGFAGELEFDAEGKVTVLPSESYGGSAAQDTLVTAREAANGLAIGNNGWLVVRSARPLKLWLRPDNLLINDPPIIVLSAAP